MDKLGKNDVWLDLRIIQAEIEAVIAANSELEDDEILRADMIEGQTSAFEFLARLERARGLARALIDGTAEYAGEIAERKARFERREIGIRAMITKVLNTARLTKVELPEASFSIRTGVRKVIITNEAQIPKDFQRHKIEPDKIKIKAALEAGEHVPGAVLSNAEPSLAIHVK